MNFVLTRKLLGTEGSLAGTSWYYPFVNLQRSFPETALKAYVQSISVQSAELTKSWNDELNSEWLVRMFLAARMVLGASLMASSSEFAQEKNLRVAVPYLHYYSLLYSMKTFVLTLPNVQWAGGAIITQTHAKTINVACDGMAKLDMTLAQETKQSVLRTKALRELLSYRAPSSGDTSSLPGWAPLPTCRVFLELAQLTSEVFERSLLKRQEGSRFDLLEEYLEQAFRTDIQGVEFLDEEDWYRVGYFARKYPMPANILHMMSEGHVEDFFGAWLANDEEEVEGAFDPDPNWGILFAVP